MKKGIKVLAAVLAVSAAAGYGVLQYKIRQFSPSLYIEGGLDCVYKNECSETYKKMLSEVPSEEQLNREYQDLLTLSSEYFMGICNIENVSDAAVQRIQELYREIYSCSRYEAGEAVRTQQGYEVPLTVYPIDIFQKVSKEDFNAFAEDFSARGAKGEFSELDDAQMEEAWAEGVIGLFENRLNELGYLEPEQITVHIDYQDGLYQISEADLQDIDEALISYKWQ